MGRMLAGRCGGIKVQHQSRLHNTIHRDKKNDKAYKKHSRSNGRSNNRCVGSAATAAYLLSIQSSEEKMKRGIDPFLDRNGRPGRGRGQV